MKPSVTFGFIGGLGTMAYLLLCYWIDRELIINPVIRHLTWLPFVVCMALPLVLIRREQALDFKAGLKEAFITYIIANACFYVFDFIMLSYIDPGLLELIAEEFDRAVEQGWIKLQPEEQEKMDHTPKFSSYLLTFAQSLIVGFLISAGLAVTFKNE